MTDRASLGRAALTYAAHGWPVFPLVPLRKVPLTPKGFLDATLDTDQIIDWWTTNPRANIGVPTGLTTIGGCGLDVYDADTPEAAQLLREKHTHPDAPPMVALTSTPRGIHFWINATGRGNRTALLPGVDYRANGGYVVVPPSVGPSGGYLWKLPPWQD